MHTFDSAHGLYNNLARNLMDKMLDRVEQTLFLSLWGHLHPSLNEITRKKVSILKFGIFFVVRPCEQSNKGNAIIVVYCSI